MKHTERDPETGKYAHQFDWIPEEYGYLDVDGNPWAGGACSACGTIQEFGGPLIAPADARRRARETKAWAAGRTA